MQRTSSVDEHDPAGRPDRQLRFAVIGAGMSGILSAVKLTEAGLTDFTVYEKNDGLGGTWHENTYPGLACDVPSHLYSYSFARNPAWTRKFVEQPEILEYLERCVDRFGLRPLLRLALNRTGVDPMMFLKKRSLLALF